jgi:hypothetical protein
MRFFTVNWLSQKNPSERLIDHYSILDFDFEFAEIFEFSCIRQFSAYGQFLSAYSEKLDMEMQNSTEILYFICMVSFPVLLVYRKFHSAYSRYMYVNFTL